MKMDFIKRPDIVHNGCVEDTRDEIQHVRVGGVWYKRDRDGIISEYDTKHMWPAWNVVSLKDTLLGMVSTGNYLFTVHTSGQLLSYIKASMTFEVELALGDVKSVIASDKGFYYTMWGRDRNARPVWKKEVHYIAYDFLDELHEKQRALRVKDDAEYRAEQVDAMRTKHQKEASIKQVQDDYEHEKTQHAFFEDQLRKARDSANRQKQWLSHLVNEKERLATKAVSEKAQAVRGLEAEKTRGKEIQTKDYHKLLEARAQLQAKVDELSAQRKSNESLRRQLAEATATQPAEGETKESLRRNLAETASKLEAAEEEGHMWQAADLGGARMIEGLKTIIDGLEENKQGLQMVIRGLGRTNQGLEEKIWGLERAVQGLLIEKKVLKELIAAQEEQLKKHAT